MMLFSTKLVLNSRLHLIINYYFKIFDLNIKEMLFAQKRSFKNVKYKSYS